MKSTGYQQGWWKALEVKWANLFNFHLNDMICILINDQVWLASGILGMLIHGNC